MSSAVYHVTVYCNQREDTHICFSLSCSLSCHSIFRFSDFFFSQLVDKSAEAALQNQRDGFMLEPIVYVGAAVCVLLLLITLITYAMFR
jgi:hypothetical protein